MVAHVAIAGWSADAEAGAVSFRLRMPVSLVRFNIRALMATSAELPDMAMAAIVGLSRNG